MNRSLIRRNNRPVETSSGQRLQADFEDGLPRRDMAAGNSEKAWRAALSERKKSMAGGCRGELSKVLILLLLGVVLPACSSPADKLSVACRHCRAMLSPNAEACPKCGEPAMAAEAAVVTNSVGMQLKPLEPGRFLMGAPDSDAKAGDEEKPSHAVEISKPFLIGVTEVTQEQFQQVMRSNPSAFSAGGRRGSEVEGVATEQLPVESVTWAEAVEFCGRLSQLPTERQEGRVYRLPTEAEWEFAAGKKSADGREPEPGSSGLVKARPDVVTATSVNGVGLFGMSDNVSEWTADWFSSDYYKQTTEHDPKGPAEGVVRAFRGAAWNSLLASRRLTVRDADVPEARRDDVGFRVICIVGDKPDVAVGQTLPAGVGGPQPERVGASSGDLTSALSQWKRAVVRLAVRGSRGDSQGSGFVIDGNGTVATNFHVIADARKVTAFFSDGFREEVSGTLGVMPDKDLAFLQLASSESRCIPLKLSDALPPEGRTVYALGSPLGLGFSVTQGIVSGIRSAMELRDAFRSEGIRGPNLSVQWVQTTAAVNWGNSGGPLIDTFGEVVGVNTLVLGRDREEGVAEGLNFAVSSQDILRAYQIIGHRAQPFRDH